MTGVALIVTGIIVIVDLGRFSNYLNASIIAPPILFIILGICIIVSSIFGFYCINKQNFNLSIVVSKYVNNYLIYTYINIKYS